MNIVLQLRTLINYSINDMNLLKYCTQLIFFVKRIASVLRIVDVAYFIVEFHGKIEY